MNDLEGERELLLYYYYYLLSMSSVTHEYYEAVHYLTLNSYTIRPSIQTFASPPVRNPASRRHAAVGARRYSLQCDSGQHRAGARGDPLVSSLIQVGQGVYQGRSCPARVRERRQGLPLLDHPASERLQSSHSAKLLAPEDEAPDTLPHL